MLDERFWTKVNKAGPDDCWEWQANRNNKGYGLFRPGGTRPKRLAHRLSYENANGRIPVGALVLHSCDNSSCVNPAHLRIGSHRQNVADMDGRGRRVTTPMPGQNNPNSRLSDADVIALRWAYVRGAGRDDLATSFGLSAKSIDDYTSGKSWRHLSGIAGSPTEGQMRERRLLNTKPSAKITADMASEIRRRISAGEMGKDLAVEYGLHKATISEIKLRKIWADVP